MNPHLLAKTVKVMQCGDLNLMGELGMMAPEASFLLRLSKADIAGVTRDAGGREDAAKR
ncbi:hypothetical protein [Mesorhizobium sp. M0208]|uniref:hypothetical protein n=1 Tax=Mesorhizobium sp. M0208 TaxID=2956916 RepID=UPI003339FEB4